ncbi:dihydrolipoamide acetyltransferase family protein [Aestuariivirga sp.]|uniref:dihydrolipoamide acetyltransferase family protein n=1 Tax=Aestuariivirga sp. TaxID=2650926 RepID=UPI0039193323
MGQYVYRLPDIGEGIAEAEIVKWHVEPGTEVEQDQALVDVMTDKATVEITSPVSGLLRQRHGAEGEKLAVGAALALFETGTGEERRSARETSSAPPIPDDGPPVRPSGKCRASPAVRARAAALKLDLGIIRGSGPDGRIVHGDLDRLLLERQARSERPPPTEPEVEEVRIFGLRRRIAERMQESKRRIPHFTYVEEVDVEDLERERARLNETGAGPHVTLLPFLIRALAAAIAEHPEVNAHFDDEAGVVRRFRPLHVGIATQTERGLLVPVIRHAERLGLAEIAAEIQRLSSEARAGKSRREELTGSTMTVTSLGALGGVMATPIINPPEVAIIGVNRMTERLALRNGEVRTRRVMNLSSSFDHRIVDGFVAASFIAAVKKALEAPSGL